MRHFLPLGSNHLADSECFPRKLMGHLIRGLNPGFTRGTYQVFKWPLEENGPPQQPNALIKTLRPKQGFPLFKPLKHHLCPDLATFQDLDEKMGATKG